MNGSSCQIKLSRDDVHVDTDLQQQSKHKSFLLRFHSSHNQEQKQIILIGNQEHILFWVAFSVKNTENK